MKNSLLLLCPLLATSLLSPAFAAPESTTSSPTAPSIVPQPTLVMPPEVAAVMLPGAKSLFLKRFPMGGTPVLLHLWMPVRSSDPDPKGSKPITPPLFVDLFAPGTQPNSWLLASSTYIHNPLDFSKDMRVLSSTTIRWLQPAKKQGMVVIVSTGLYDEINHRDDEIFMDAVAFPNGPSITPGYRSDAVVSLNFHHGDEADSTRSQKFGIDKNGYMTIEDTITPWGGHLHDSGGSSPSTTVYRWRDNVGFTDAK